jgi:protein TonB
VVSFTINGGGSVTRVALVRGTGIASLDREAQAMVNRSSPFPPPPSQRPMRFTVPVSFDIR